MRVMAKTVRWLVGWAGLAVLLGGCATVDPVQDGGYRVSQAWLQHQPVPLVQPLYGKALTAEIAYRIQHQALEQVLQGRAPAGFKAGLTSLASQQAFGAGGPVAGVLLPGSGLMPREDGYHVDLAEYRQPMAEVEIGFRMTHEIRYPLPDVQALKAAVLEVLPVVELPDIAHAGRGSFTPLDLIATNVAAKHYIAGPARAASVTDPDTLAITLYRDGQPLTRGTAFDVVGDQWQVLLWLVNRTLASGYTIEPGQVLITGTLGDAVPLKRGLYVADYGSFGRIEWWVE